MTKFSNGPILIIDSHSLIHRAYHALPFLTAKNGEPVNAVYGFFSIFLKAIKDLRPSCFLAAFDSAAPTFRHQEFAGYKAKRVKAPDDFYQQIPRIKEILTAFRVPIFAQDGFEADDVVGTLVSIIKKEKSPNLEIIILSSDNDFLQLVQPGVKVLILKKGISQTQLYDEGEVRKRYDGLSPGQLVDFKALRGDASDNIPGAKGIGEKTAIKLINRFQNLEALYGFLDNPEKTDSLAESVTRKLKEAKESVFASRRLARIREDVPVNFSLADSGWNGGDLARVEKIFEELQFSSLLSRLPRRELFS